MHANVGCNSAPLATLALAFVGRHSHMHAAASAASPSARSTEKRARVPPTKTPFVCMLDAKAIADHFHGAYDRPRTPQPA
jgi:hypothetical protein